MNDTNLIDELKKNDRYFYSMFCTFILGLLLLFAKDLSDWMRNIFIPAFVVYVIGTALIAQIQNMLGNRKTLRCQSEKKDFVGLETWQFSLIIAGHLIWITSFVIYLCRLAP